jgi:flagellar biosynthetic protein FlhB
MSEERTEEATPRRREEARKRGQVARSAEVTTTAGLLGGLAILQASGSLMLSGFSETMRRVFSRLPTTPPEPADLTAAGLTLAMQMLLWVAPLLGGLLVLGVVANVAQVGLVVSGQGITPDFNRVNPAQGFKRLFGRRGMVEFAKALVKLAVVGTVTYQIFLDRYQAIVMMTGSDPVNAAGLIGSAIFELAFKAGFGLLVLAVLDYGYQRWEHSRSLRMSRQEIKDELKQSEGDPHIKARIRRTQRQMAMRRMMQAVPTSDVVLTNPTHLAVALRYDASRMDAPVVVAKGAELIAERIKTLAREHGVPVVENKPLARALHAACELGDQVPADLYQAVAEVLAFIFSLRRPAAGSSRQPAPPAPAAADPATPRPGELRAADRPAR